MILIKTTTSSRALSKARSQFAAAALLIASGVLSSTSTFANEEPLSDAIAPPTKVAFYLRNDPYSLQHVLPDRLGSQELESLAEEASKHAQARYLAEKWGQPKKTVMKYVNLAWSEARKREGLEPELIIAIMQKESSLRPKVQSAYGAQGLMQVVRRWHREKLRPSESLFDPEVNVRVGADVLEEYLELAGGSLTKALTKYSGSARGYAAAVIKESRKLARVADEAAAEVKSARADSALNAG